MSKRLVDDLGAAIAGKDVMIEPNGPGVTVAFIVHDGAPIESLEFTDLDHEVWPGNATYER